MTPLNARRVRALILLGLLTLAAGCASRSPVSPPVVVQPARIPPLPAQARQPTPPSECLPTCSAGLMRLRTELLDLLTRPTAPAAPASAPTTR